MTSRRAGAERERERDDNLPNEPAVFGPDLLPQALDLDQNEVALQPPRIGHRAALVLVVGADLGVEMLE
jgi:hypothetical protein